jgi:hypothetical protein
MPIRDRSPIQSRSGVPCTIRLNESKGCSIDQPTSPGFNRLPVAGVPAAVGRNKPPRVLHACTPAPLATSRRPALRRDREAAGCRALNRPRRWSTGFGLARACRSSHGSVHEPRTAPRRGRLGNAGTARAHSALARDVLWLPLPAARCRTQPHVPTPRCLVCRGERLGRTRGHHLALSTCDGPTCCRGSTGRDGTVFRCLHWHANTRSRAGGQIGAHARRGQQPVLPRRMLKGTCDT